MPLQNSYPKEWKEIRNKEVPHKKINEYIINFVRRLIGEVKEGTRDHIDLGDGFGMGLVQSEGSGYKLNPILREFLIELSDYNGEGWGSPQTPEEVEIRLKKVIEKMNIN